MLYIMRHGITQWNKDQRLQGRTDVPLCQEGIDLAKEAAEKCRDVHFDICFASPLQRASQTAQIVLEGRDVPIYYDDRLVEMCFGECEGELNYRDPSKSRMGVLFSDPASYIPVEGGESLEELFERTGSFLKEKVFPLVKEGKDVLIVGHGAMNSSIVCHIRDKGKTDFWGERIENCKLIKLI